MSPGGSGTAAEQAAGYRGFETTQIRMKNRFRPLKDPALWLQHT